MPVKVLTSLVKVIPEVEPYIKLNQDQIKAANKTNAYGGGAKFSWAPNLLATSQKKPEAESPPKPKAKVPQPKGAEAAKKVEEKPLKKAAPKDTVKVSKC